MAHDRDLARLARQMRGRAPLRASLLLFVVLSCIASAVTWAALTEIDDATRAEARVVPSGDIQIIEAAEAGVLQSLHVAEGDMVEAGAPLMDLDGVLLDSQLDQERQRAYGLRARIIRLEAEIAGTALVFDKDLLTHAPELVASETALWQGRAAALQAQIDILERQRLQRAQDLREGEAERGIAERTLAVLGEERDMIAPLVARGMEPATTLLALRRSEADWQGRRGRALAVLERQAGALAEIDDRIAAEHSRARAAALDDLARATAELAALRPALPALQSRAQRARITAPVRGIVNRLHRTTAGATARPGDPLAEIVPVGDTPVVEAWLRPADIAFLHPGQAVRVQITAYDAARYGRLDGEILRIGADAVRRSDRDTEDVFVVEIRTSGSLTDADGTPVAIIPGMMAQVDILTGRKTVLDYLIRPVLRLRDSALRD